MGSGLRAYMIGGRSATPPGVGWYGPGPPRPALWWWAPLGADFVHLLLVLGWFFGAGVGLALALAPSVVVVWAPLGADFVHVACFGLDLRGWWGPRPRPLCGCGVSPFGG